MLASRVAISYLFNGLVDETSLGRHVLDFDDQISMSPCPGATYL